MPADAPQMRNLINITNVLTARVANLFSQKARSTHKKSQKSQT